MNSLRRTGARTSVKEMGSRLNAAFVLSKFLRCETRDNTQSVLAFFVNIFVLITCSAANKVS